MIYEIVEHIGVITKHPNGWTKELNIAIWNGEEPKFDIRDWCRDFDGVHMSRGIKLDRDEAYALYKMLGEYFENSEA